MPKITRALTLTVEGVVQQCDNAIAGLWNILLGSPAEVPLTWGGEPLPPGTVLSVDVPRSLRAGAETGDDVEATVTGDSAEIQGNRFFLKEVRVVRRGTEG